MKNALLLALAVCVAAAACTKKAQAPAVDLKTEDQKTLYALGLVMSENLNTFGLSEADVELVKAGFTDGALKRTRQVDLAVYGPKLKDLAQARSSAGAAAEKASGGEFLARAALEKGAVKTPAGFVIQEITPGTGPSPKQTDTVKVHYSGTLIDGTVFDSSLDRGEPVVFPLANVVPCWTQGVQMMKVGGKSRLVCPPELAYGDRGAPPKIKPGATLNFEVELIEIVKP
jgi:FKBP-type peptidyl-prolyl cis-trans isomerase FkpA/FKBP-type peptidyl-prolyl cis-trans isomerase FklB